MYKKINTYLSDNYPNLGIIKRYLIAIHAHYSRKAKTYAQYNEDNLAIDILKKININSIFYIDVGANHPSKFSNTYLMYRNGASGITIDPNNELMYLHKMIRPRDTQLKIGCGKLSGLHKFYTSKTPVLSSYSKAEVCNLWHSDYLPVFRLDEICRDLQITSIDFLSIDVEGLDLDVLMGAEEILKKTALICIEANNKIAQKEIEDYLEARDFNLKNKNKCNLFFTNKIFQQ